MRGRKGYFFIVDAVIASMVLFAGLFILFGGGVRTQESVQPLTTVDDLITMMSSTPISETVNPYALSELLPRGLVPYADTTPLEEIAYLTYAPRTGACALTNCTDHATNYTKSLFDGALGAQYGAQLSMNGTVIARQEHSARYTYARPIIVYARINTTTVVGPLPGEVQLWG